MKRNLLKFIVAAMVIFTIIALLNMSVTTRQGVNFKVKALKIPLYLKVLDFFDRHYNYKVLVKGITRAASTDEEKVFNIFEWTYNHIKPQPKGLPIMDDHVWYIIIRGYGAGEQSTDVFTTLCNYAGFEATYYWIGSSSHADQMALSFVRIGEKWSVFDQYRGVYFKNKDGRFADMEELRRGDYIVGYLPGVTLQAPDYRGYLTNIPFANNIRFSRANRQSPLKRFTFEVGEWLKLNKR